jgi:hypothetical protein
VAVNEREEGYLGTFPAHWPDVAQRLAARLFPDRRYEPRGRTDLDRALHPEHLAIGAYAGAAIVAHREATLGAIVAGEDDPLVSGLFGLYPEAALLSVQLQSTVEVFAFAYFERGTLLRSCAGTADDGIVEAHGAPLPEERPFLPPRVGVDPVHGQRTDLDAGEERVFAVASRFFGAPLNAVPLWNLQMEDFVARSPRRRSWRLG